MKRAKVLALASVPMALAIGFASTAVAVAADQPAKPAAAGSPKPSLHQMGVSPLNLGAPVTIPAGGWSFAFVDCPSGVPVSGGGGTSDTDIFLTDSHATGTGWVVGGRNTGSFDQTLTPYVYCLA